MLKSQHSSSKERRERAHEVRESGLSPTTFSSPSLLCPHPLPNAYPRSPPDMPLLHSETPLKNPHAAATT